jgi:GTPase SAR1 family protein
MFHAFALQGPGNCGKTTTLLKLYEELKAEYPSATIKHLHHSTTDISVILSGINGNVVGIESRGEPGSRLINSLNAFVAAKCDIVFCACRTKGMTVQWVKTLPLQYKIHFVAQTRVKTNFTATNTSTVELLMRKADI